MKPILYFFFSLAPLFSGATVWHTIADGYWNQTYVWQNGIIPPLASSDSIYFHHEVALTNDITLTNGGYMQVDSAGGICGHITLTIGENATMIKYGYCQIDVLLVPGGDVDFYLPGYSIFALWAQISNGGSFNMNGSGLTVGAWFQCQKGPAAIDESEQTKVRIYPNPFNDLLYFVSENGIITEINLYDSDGKWVLTHTGSCLHTAQLSPGIYLAEIKQKDFIIRKRVVKTD